MVREYVQLLRELKEYTQKDLSILSGVNLGRVQRFEQGKLKMLKDQEISRIYLSLGGHSVIAGDRPKTWREKYLDCLEADNISLSNLMELTNLTELQIANVLCHTNSGKIYHEDIIAGRLGFKFSQNTVEWEFKIIELMDESTKVIYKESLRRRFEQLKTNPE